MNDKIFDPNSFEEELYECSLETFACDVVSENSQFSTMMPPPNVTGSLHLGHALTYTLPDILVRFKRMQGYDVLWQPGTDHAGIATQIVVERQLAGQSISRHGLGREEFLKKVWQWKEQSGSTIVSQQKRLRISPDWGRQCFTMDKGLSNAVVGAFVRLYEDKLIYRDKRLVNWDAKLQTAVSDLEVVNRQEKGSLWYIDYPIDGGSKITVATTRPETMLGDTAVAVHPEDDRYKDLIGKFVKLPIADRLIPIIGDEYCDPLKGSGAVKITPAHDFNDFLVGQRHKLPMINILNKDGTLNDQAPIPYQGLTIYKARAKILAELENAGLLAKEEPITHMKSYSDRTDTEVQPFLTDQWFVDAKTLAEPAIKAVMSGEIKFFPERWENTYFAWMENIQPWCISRQIWWGHQVPAWYGPDHKIFVAKTEEEAFEQAHKYYGKKVELTRDQDVLDTWFSSALWPFATLGWPNKTKELDRYYPTDILVTGFDIIFFWVARMIMMGLYFTKKVPFKHVYIHNLVRDEKGQKMSKSKGNIIDPIELLDKYGSDALRFTLALLASPDSDIRIGEKVVENSRNFVTKIRNAARFLKMQGINSDLPCHPLEGGDPDLDSCLRGNDIRGNGNRYIKEVIQNKNTHPLNLWMILEIVMLAERINDLGQQSNVSHAQYRFDHAAQDIYQIVWGSFCDFYIEAMKTLLKDDRYKAETAYTALWCFSEILKIAYPFMPMITDYLWQMWHNESITKEKWLSTKELADSLTDSNDDLRDHLMQAFSGTKGIKDLIFQVRSRKGTFNLPSSKKVSITVSETIYNKQLEQQSIQDNSIHSNIQINKNLCVSKNIQYGKSAYINTDQIKKFISIIQNMAGVKEIHFGQKNKNFTQTDLPFIWGNRTICLHLADVIWVEEMKKILQKKLDILKTETDHLGKKIENEAYKNAKPDQWGIDKDACIQKQGEYRELEAILSNL